MVLDIFNLLGQKIYSAERIHNQAGEYFFTWYGVGKFGNKVGSGMYFCKMNFLSINNNQVLPLRKMILLH